MATFTVQAAERARGASVNQQTFPEAAEKKDALDKPALVIGDAVAAMRVLCGLAVRRDKVDEGRLSAAHGRDQKTSGKI